MNVRAVDSVPNYASRERKTDNGNMYELSSVAKATGLVSGLVISGVLGYSQIKSLKTIGGKRNLIASLHEKGKTLNDILKRSVKRDEAGKIIPPEEGKMTDRTKKVINGFKTTLVAWGAGITGTTTIFGHLIDSNINLSRERQADLEASE